MPGLPTVAAISRIRRRLARLAVPDVHRLLQPFTHGLPPGTLVFRCNICGAICRTLVENLQRESAHCPTCDSSMRYRAVIHHLSLGLFGRSLCIDEFPQDAHCLAGIGMSDSDKYAMRLAKRLAYTNTYYHQEPRFDIQNAPPEYERRFAFVISSDVLEHVAPPVEHAFRNLHRVLVPGGTLVLTVPFATEGDTVEHFPDLFDYRLAKQDDRYVLHNTTSNGRLQAFDRLCFHGGPGSTLEMRLFSESALRKHLSEAGFSNICVHREPAFEWGVFWNAPWSVPITATA